MTDKGTLNALKIFGKLEDKGMYKIQFIKDNKVIAEVEDLASRIEMSDCVGIDEHFNKQVVFDYTIPRLVVDGHEVYYDKMIFEVDWTKELKQ